MTNYTPPLPPQNFLPKQANPPVRAVWLNAMDNLLQGNIPATGPYDPSIVSGQVQVTGPGGNLISYGDLVFELQGPNPSGIPCPVLSLGGAGKLRACITTDAQTPGLPGLQLIIAAGESDDPTQPGGELLLLGGAGPNLAGPVTIGGGTSLNGTGGSTTIRGGNSTNGIAGNLFLAGGLNGPLGGGSVHLIMSDTAHGTNPGSIVFRVNSVVLWTITASGALFLGSSGAGTPGQILVSNGPNALPSWVAGTGSVLQYPQTPAEASLFITVTNFNIPSHLVTSEIYPQRYGAAYDGVTLDTVANQAAFNLSTITGCFVVLPPGISINGNLTYGSNATASSQHGPGIRGQYNSSTLKMVNGGAGTLLQARGCAAMLFRDFTLDGAGITAVGIDTSWPTTPGTTNNNVYENVIVQNFTQVGWLAINDNQSKWKQVQVRGGASPALSAMQIEGSGGSFTLDTCLISPGFLSLTCQNANIIGGLAQGVRVNETQNGVNDLYFQSTQIYVNPSTQTHFEDAGYNLPGHFVTNLSLDGCYLLSSNGTLSTSTLNCGFGGKVKMTNCFFVNGSSGVWNLFGPHIFNAFGGAIPPVVELDGCSTDLVQFNTPTPFVLRLRDVASTVAGFTGIYSDATIRKVFQQTLAFPAGLSANAFTNIVPASAMTEPGGYLLTVYVQNPAADTLSATLFVNSVPKVSSGLAPSATIAAGTTANLANNLVNQLSFRYSGTIAVGSSNFAGVDLAVNTTLNNNSTIGVTLIRIANPNVNY